MTVQRVQHPVHPLCIHVIILNMVRAMNPDGQNNALRQQHNVILSTLQHNALSCSCSQAALYRLSTNNMPFISDGTREEGDNVQHSSGRRLSACLQSIKMVWKPVDAFYVHPSYSTPAEWILLNATQTFRQQMTQCWHTCFNFVVNDGRPMCPALCCACLQKISHGHLQNVSQDEGRKGLNTNRG